LIQLGVGREAEDAVRRLVQLSLFGFDRIGKVGKSVGDFAMGAKRGRGAGATCGDILFAGPAAEIDHIGFHSPTVFGAPSRHYRNKAGCEPNGMALGDVSPTATAAAALVGDFFDDTEPQTCNTRRVPGIGLGRPWG
jgi:hypothetical protein